MSRGETVKILRSSAGAADSMGEAKPGTAPDPVSIAGCAVWWTGTEERGVLGGTPVATEGVVKFPTGTHVNASDRLEIRGDPNWRVDGTPADWRSFYTRRRPGVIVKVKRVTTNG